MFPFLGGAICWWHTLFAITLTVVLFPFPSSPRCRPCLTKPSNSKHRIVIGPTINWASLGLINFGLIVAVLRICVA
ncbi:hypothetical protein B0O80DRAFT_439786 [Mortierella sp. GBAus27b]|nr:hypothetical protein B0O80DRAFT_439786 [Mortierella sp. GBAus27b]